MRILTVVLLLAPTHLFCQELSDTSISPISLNYTDDFTGFHIVDTKNPHAVFVIAEDMHNRRHTPVMTYKFLQHLHTEKNIRVFGIEHGASTAFLLNRFLQNHDTTLLREITRHTFFWSIEHFEFWQALCAWNKSLPPDQRIVVESADIEIKQESVVLAVNILLDRRQIPPELALLEQFQEMYKEKESHRNNYPALNTLYYYDKTRCRSLVEMVSKDVKTKADQYKQFFQEDFNLFQTMIEDLQRLYEFNYRTGWKFKYRDEIMYQKLLSLANKYPTGFFHVVGGRHAQPGASSFLLKYDSSSPIKGKVAFINLTGRKSGNKYHGAKIVTQLAEHNPNIFVPGNDVIIRNITTSKMFFDYTIAYRDNEHVRAFRNSYTGKKLKK